MTDQKQRPTFLTVLCILTWVGSGWVIISKLISLATAGLTKEMAGMAEEGMDEAMEEIVSEAPGFAPFLSKLIGQGMQALEHLTELALTRILGVLIVLAGSIFMWKLKKLGYYMFIAGKVVIIASIIIIVGGAGLGIFMILGPLFVALVFAILYGVNLKAME